MYKYQATYKRVLSTLPLLFSFWGKKSMSRDLILARIFQN